MQAAKRVVLVGMLMMVASTVAQASAANQSGTFIRCSWRAQDQGYLKPQGIQLGVAHCGSPLGAGHFRGTFHNTVHLRQAAESGALRLVFATGSVHASYRVSGLLQHATYRGTLRISGRSGRLKHALGALQITCSGVWTVVCHASGP